jgi:hypothetical protein
MIDMSDPQIITDVITTADVVAVDEELEDADRVVARLRKRLAEAGPGDALALVLTPIHLLAETPSETVRRLRIFVSALDDGTTDQAHEYIERLMPDDVARPEPAVLTQLYRNVELRVRFLETHETWDAAEVAEFAGSTAKNKSATAARWRSDGLVFAVDYRGDLLYPAFQFDVDTRKPKPAIAELLEAFAANDASEWEIAVWLTHRHPDLGAPPIEVLDQEPERVLAALGASYEVAA